MINLRREIIFVKISGEKITIGMNRTAYQNNRYTVVSRNTVVKS